MRKRRRIKYQPEPDDGQVRQLREIAPEHFVYATEQEVPYYAKLKRQRNLFWLLTRRDIDAKSF